MIKSIYRCDPIQWGVLFYLLILVLLGGHIAYGISCGSEYDLFSQVGLLEAKDWPGIILNGLLLLLIPFVFRRGMKRSGALGFNERVSFYPIGLFTITCLLSCNTTPLLIVTLCISLLVNRVLSLNEGDILSKAAFEGGVIISICSLFSYYFLIEIVFLWIAFSVIRPLDWKSLLWSLIGLVAIQYLYYSGAYILTGEFIITLDSLHMMDETDLIENRSMGFLPIAYLIVNIALVLLMLSRSLKESRGGIVRRRKVIRIGIILLVVNLVISSLLFQFQGVSPFSSLLAVPLSIIFLDMMEGEHPILYGILFFLWTLLTFMITWN